MKATALIEEIRSFCKNNGDPALVQKYSRYFKEGYDAYGVSTTLFLEKVRSLLSSGTIDLPVVIEAGYTLMKSSKYEEPAFVILLLKGFQKKFDRATFGVIGDWFGIGIRNWAHSDTVCSEVLSPMLLKKIIAMEDLAAWKDSSFPFQRRAVPVALIKTAKKSADIQPFLYFLEPLMADRERVVHQGMGWFLREAWKIFPEPVEAFLLKWRNSAARLIFQYATEKMAKEDRVKFRRDKPQEKK